MVKLNTGVPVSEGPFTTAKTPTGLTFEGGTGWLRDEKNELYLRATTMFAGENTFYEKAETHDKRSIELVRQITLADWAWVSGFLPWLRKSGNIRTMSIILAAQAVHARLGSKSSAGLSNRQLINAVIQRPDECGEMLQYWLLTFGKPIPMPVKRGVADAASRMFNERNTLRYDGKGAVQFGNIVSLTRPQPRSVPQSKLFKHLITASKHRSDHVPDPALGAIKARYDLSRLDPIDRHVIAKDALNGNTDAIFAIQQAAAGQWEWVISWLGEGKPKNALTKADQWSLVIPDMGYMALIRNLRNFDQAGIKPDLADAIAERIASPAEVALSKQLPFRFLSAYKATTLQSVRWGNALEKALQASIPNIPEMPGKTLVLIDTSGSMEGPMSGGGPRQDASMRPTRMEAGALFGVALTLKNPKNTDLYAFASGQMKIQGIGPGQSILKTVESITRSCGRVGHGTDIEAAIRNGYKNHDRVCVLTDMQTVMPENYYGRGYGDIASAVPSNKHVYGFNLAGYSNSAMPTGSHRHEMGGLTDHTFGLIPLLESGAAGDWPWNN